MTYRFVKHIFLPFLLSVVLISCGGEKAVVSSSSKEMEKYPPLDKSTAKKVERTFMDAQKAKMLDEYDEAETLFKMVLKDAPNHDVAHYELALIYFQSQSQDLNAALKHIESAVKYQPNNKWYLLLQAEILTDIGKFDEAAAIVSRLVDENPKEYDYYFHHASLLIQASKYREAIAVYDKLEKITGIDEQIIEQKKRLYLRLDDIGAAAQEQEKLIEAFPKDGRYYSRLADLYRANGMEDKADEVFERLLLVDENNPYALLAIAYKKFETGDKEGYKENLKKALSNRELSIDLKIRSLYPYIEFNELYKDDMEIAIELADEIIGTHPEDARSYAIKGDLLYLEERMEEALKAYEIAVEKDPSVFNVWRQMMFIHSDLSDFDGLKKISGEAKEYFPNQPFVYYFEGVALHQLKEYDKAIRSYDKAILMSDANKALQAQLWANMGDVYHELNNNIASDSSYDNSLAIDPDNPYVLNNYSYYLSLRANQLIKARDMSKKANDLVPENSAFLDTYAWILYKLKEYEEAKEWQEKALKAGGDDRPVLLEHYGDILFHLGEIDSALDYWNRALEKGGDADALQKKISEKKLYED